MGVVEALHGALCKRFSDNPTAMCIILVVMIATWISTVGRCATTIDLNTDMLNVLQQVF
jgi:tetrahydromethanopterin S-methyltransferase subunit E